MDLVKIVCLIILTIITFTKKLEYDYDKRIVSNHVIIEKLLKYKKIIHDMYMNYAQNYKVSKNRLLDKKICWSLDY